MPGTEWTHGLHIPQRIHFFKWLTFFWLLTSKAMRSGSIELYWSWYLNHILYIVWYLIWTAAWLWHASITSPSISIIFHIPYSIFQNPHERDEAQCYRAVNNVNLPPDSLPHLMFCLLPGNPNVMICGSENKGHVTFECKLTRGVEECLWSPFLRLS